MIVALIAVTGFGIPERCEADWGQFGLESLKVYDVQIYGGEIFAGTDDGIHRFNLAYPDSGWLPVGMQGFEVTDVLVTSSSVIFAGVTNSTYTLYRTTDGGTEWNPLPWGVQAGPGYPIYSITSVNNSSSDLLAGGLAVIASSYDAGMIWNAVWGDWIFMGMGIHFIRATASEPLTMWAGGESAIFSAVLLKSYDGGNSWISQAPPAGGDNRCHDVATLPDNPDVAYVGMEGVIGRTLDGGDNWHSLYYSSLYHYTVEIDPIRPLIVYVSGSHSTAPATIVKSTDGGESWVEISDDQFDDNFFYDFVMINDTDSNVLYCGTANGILTYIDYDLDFDSTYICGDLDDDTDVDSLDLSFLLYYISSDGMPPFPLESGDVDGCEGVNIADAAYLSRYVFASGAAPCSSSAQCEIEAPTSSVRIECPITVTDPSVDSVAVPIFIESDSLLSGLTLGFSIDGQDVSFSSIDLSESTLSQSQRQRCTCRIADDQTSILVTWLDFRSDEPLDVTTEHHLCKLWVQIPDSSPDQDVDIDSIFVSSAGEFIFTPQSGGIIHPDFVDCGTADIVVELSDYICGNADGLGSVDIDDVVYLIAYIFSGGPAPEPLAAGDAECSMGVDIDDVVYLIGYIFSGGPPPCDPDDDGPPDC